MQQPETASGISPALSILELVASNEPDGLEWLTAALRHSPVGCRALDSIAIEHCGGQVLSAAELAAVLTRAAGDLDHLSRSRRWNHPRDVVDSPNLEAITALCSVRVARGRARQTWQAVYRKLIRARAGHRVQRLRAGGDIRLSREWLMAFLGWDAKRPTPRVVGR